LALSDREIDLIRAGFRELRSDIQPRSEAFYAAFFRRAPELRPMFREDLSGQGMRFMSTLAVLLDHLNDPETLAERYADLGRSHRALGVKAAYFEVMGEALIETLQGALGEAFTPETEEAWRKAYGQFSLAVMAAAGIGQ